MKEDVCYLCGMVLGRKGAVNHLDSCVKTHVARSQGRLEKCFRIVVSGDYFLNPPNYWLILEAAASAKLKHLDRFLRKIWLECCGHLSAFTIDGHEYLCDAYFIEPPEPGQKRMNYRLEEVLYNGCEFSYEYNFGSTTELRLNMLRVEDFQLTGRFAVLARNLPPKFKCDVCGSEASMVCGVCEVNSCDTAFLCGKHAKKHVCKSCGCDPEYPLPITNSPRVGVCGYTGVDDEWNVERVKKVNYTKI